MVKHLPNFRNIYLNSPVHVKKFFFFKNINTKGNILIVKHFKKEQFVTFHNKHSENLYTYISHN